MAQIRPQIHGLDLLPVSQKQTLMSCANRIWLGPLDAAPAS